MNIIKKILMTRTGKVALSGMQTLGLATGIAVAGVGGYFALTSQQDINPDTVFSSYDEGDIVYVAGHSAAGRYAGVSTPPVEGGEVKSGFQATLSHGLRMMNEENAKPVLLDVERQEQDLVAYKMDGETAGLGVAVGQQGTPSINTKGGNDMAAIQAQIAALQANVQAQQQAAAAAAASAEGATPAPADGANGGDGDGKPSFGARNRDWGKNPLLNVGGGHDLGADGLSGSTYSGPNSSPTVEGTTIKPSLSPASGPIDTPLYAGGDRWRRGGKVQGMELDSLTAMTKQSADIANRGGDASDIFMSGEGYGPAGITLSAGSKVNTGGGGGSVDLTGGDSFVAGIGAKTADFQQEAESYADARKALVKELNKFVRDCTGISFTSFLGYILARNLRNKMKAKIEAFEARWNVKPAKGESGAHYATDQYWKKAKHVMNWVYGVIGGGPVAVLIAWAAASAKEFGRKLEKDEGAIENGGVVHTRSGEVARDSLRLRENSRK
ncbi:MAG: hypothetical protein IKL48_06190 [Elusimicrobiaceae bacterium]|nr:hypothetical protein [Elusimicrobiaceae bacterium]